MPGTETEHVAFAIDSEWVYAEGMQWADGTGITQADARDIVALRECFQRWVDRKCGEPQIRALALFKSFLSRTQRRELSKHKQVTITAPSGSRYRLWPNVGLVELATLHGKRWFRKTSFCLHDEDGPDAMPPADRSLGHMLLILSDEPAFLAAANATDTRDQLWNGAYRRRLREARRARQTQEAP